jgi:hypothetical protein
MVTVTIANGATVSDAADFHSSCFSGIVLPAAFTGTALTFQVSHDGVTYQGLYNPAGNAVSLTVAGASPARTYSFSADIAFELSHWRWVKVVSNAAEGADRSVILWAR